MTDKTDIEALRESLVALNRTFSLISSVPTRKWADDAAHSFIKSGGINLVIERLDHLEAERQRREAAEEELTRVKEQSRNRLIGLCNAGEKRETAEAELVALRGEQEPAVRNFCNPATTGFIIEELESLAANLRAGRKG